MENSDGMSFDCSVHRALGFHISPEQKNNAIANKSDCLVINSILFKEKMSLLKNVLHIVWLFAKQQHHDAVYSVAMFVSDGNFPEHPPCEKNDAPFISTLFISFSGSSRIVALELVGHL